VRVWAKQSRGCRAILDGGFDIRRSAVRCGLGCHLDDLVPTLPGLTRNQAMLEVDRLSRTGQVRVTSWGEGTYTVKLPKKGT